LKNTDGQQDKSQSRARVGRRATRNTPPPRPPTTPCSTTHRCGCSPTTGPAPKKGSFAEILQRVQAVHDLKGADYGNEEDEYANLVSSKAWGIPPWVAAMQRSEDKHKRLQAFHQRGVLRNESVEDSLRDNAAYGVIAWLLYEMEEGS
jgi:hypothetical protein